MKIRKKGYFWSRKRALFRCPYRGVLLRCITVYILEPNDLGNKVAKNLHFSDFDRLLCLEKKFDFLLFDWNKKQWPVYRCYWNFFTVYTLTFEDVTPMGTLGRNRINFWGYLGHKTSDTEQKHYSDWFKQRSMLKLLEIALQLYRKWVK